MKILLLNYEYPPVGGGGGRLCQKVAEALAARGHEIRVVTAGLAHLPVRETRGGVEIFRPRSFRRREDTCTVPEMALYVLTALPTALREARRWRPDILHAHFVVPTGLLALGVAWLTGRPYVITAHLGDVPGGVPEQTGGLFRFAAPLARRIWCGAAARTAVSGYVARLAQEAFGLEATIVPNGIPAIDHQPARCTPDGRMEILWVGRFSVQKNPLLAIQAVGEISRDVPWRLRMIGEGPLFEEARKAAAPCGGRVEFPGWLPEADVRKALSTSDVLLMTSRHEGLPMVGVEALWHGLAIVGTRIGGMSDIVPDESNGRLVDPNPSDLADALSRFGLQPDSLEACRTASRRLAPAFDFDRTVALYEDVLTRATRRSE